MPALSAGPGAPDAWEAAWAEALGALEVDVARAESLLAAARTGTAYDGPAPGAGWTAPDLPGPLPDALQARARAVLDRQARVSADLARGIAAARRDVLLAQRLAEPGPDRSTPAFLDAAF